MNFYVQHQDGVPISLGSVKLNETDALVDEVTAMLFYEGKDTLDAWRVVRGQFVRDTLLLSKRIQKPRILELELGTPSTESDIMISLVVEQQAIDIFFDTYYQDALSDVMVYLYVDDTTKEIRFDEFINGHLRLYVPLSLTSTFKLSDNFRSVGLVTNYYVGRYRSVKDRLLPTKVVNGKYILPQHLYHSMAYYAKRSNPSVVVKSELVATEATYNPNLITVVGNHELRPA